MRKIHVPFDPERLVLGGILSSVVAAACYFAMAFPPYSPWVERVFLGSLIISAASLRCPAFLVKEANP